MAPKKNSSKDAFETAASKGNKVKINSAQTAKKTTGKQPAEKKPEPKAAPYRGGVVGGCSTMSINQRRRRW